MFTGLVEEVGRVATLRKAGTGAHLTVRTSLKELTNGESIAVNGVCQTIVEARPGTFSCNVLQETLRVTNLGLLRPGSLVNLERALRAGDRMGGHIVNGHVDGIGVVTGVSSGPRMLEISVEDDVFMYLVPKGCVAVDGISLTVGPEPSRGRFEVYIIEHTWEMTNIKNVRIGSHVNIEVDIIGKYIYGFMKK